MTDTNTVSIERLPGASDGATAAKAAGDAQHAAEPNHAPAVTAAASSSTGLLGARRELALLQAQVQGAADALTRCQEPVARLRELIAEADAAERDLETRRQRHLTEIGEWLAGGGSPNLRPVEPPELLAAEQHLIRRHRDAAAARNVIADHEAVVAAAVRHLSETKARRDD